MNAAQMIVARMRAEEEKQNQPSAASAIVARMRADQGEKEPQLPEGAVSNEEFDQIGADGNEYSGWNTAQDQADAAREFYGGITLGGADEIEAAWKAAFSDRESGEGFGDAYSRHKKQINAEQDKFRKENSGSALMLSLAGGLMTGGAETALARKIGAKTLAKIVPQALAKSRLAKNVATAASIGGTAGALSNDEDRLRGGLTGSVFGTGISLAPGLLGKAGGAMTRGFGRIASDTGEFIPLGLREDVPRLIRDSYNMIGKTFSPKYREQVNEFVGKKADEADRLEAIAVGKRNAQIAKTKDLKNKISDRQDDTIHELSLKRDAAKQAADDLADKQNTRLSKSVKYKTKKAQEKLEEEIEELDNQIRLESVKASLPNTTEAEQVAKIQKMPAQKAMTAIEKEWDDEAFSYVKSRDFDIDPNEVLVGTQEKLIGSGGERYMDDVEKVLERSLFNRIKNGKMTGKDILEARNDLGRAISDIGTSSEGSVKRASLKKTKDIIDNIIKRQLDDDAPRFVDDLKRYQHKMVLRKASEGAEAVKREGNITTDEYLTALANKQKSLAREGRGSLQGVATEKRKEQILKKATTKKKIEAMKERAETTKGERASVLSKTKKKIEQGKFEEEKPIKAQSRKTKDWLDKRLREKDAGKLSIEGKKAEELREFVKKNAIGDPNVFTQLASSRVIGAILGAGGLALGAPTVPLGIAASHALSSKGLQKALLGQTGFQRKLRSEIAKYFPEDKRDEAFDFIMRLATRKETQQ